MYKQPHKLVLQKRKKKPTAPPSCEEQDESMDGLLVYYFVVIRLPRTAPSLYEKRALQWLQMAEKWSGLLAVPNFVQPLSLFHLLNCIRFRFRVQLCAGRPAWSGSGISVRWEVQSSNASLLLSVHFPNPHYMCTWSRFVISLTNLGGCRPVTYKFHDHVAS